METVVVHRAGRHSFGLFRNVRRNRALLCSLQVVHLAVKGGMMNYEISDEQFKEELRVNAFINQVQGYPVGSRRMSFKPILVTFPDGNGGIDRPKF